jgi:large subunit ribosomal protein L5
MATEAPVVPRLKERYRSEIASALKDEFGYGNVMQIPGLTKIVVNMGVGEAARDAKLIEGAVRDLSTITGQKPAVARAKKSVAQFKLREGMPIGAHATLRGDRMWEFLDRLLTIALPRIRDFRGLSDRQFDGQGNYTFGLTEQLMFHEIDPDKVDRQRGMDITVVTPRQTTPKAARCCGGSASRSGSRRQRPRSDSGTRGKEVSENGKEGADRQAEAHAEVQGPGLHPVRSLRAAAGRLPQVQPVPDLLPYHGAPRRAAWHHQVQLVERAHRRSGRKPR